VDASVLAGCDFWDGRTLSDMPFQDILGGCFSDNLKVTQDGAQAVATAASIVMGGHDDVVLVLGAIKESIHTSRFAITNYGMDPIFQRPLGIDYLTAAAIQAQGYMHRYKITREQCAQVVVKARQNAAKNHRAHVSDSVTVQEVLDADMVADPIGALDIYPTTDGAIAMIITNEQKARELTDKPIWITGIASGRDAHNLGSRELTECRSLTSAAKKLYNMADISDPQKEIDLVELSESFSYQELLWSEGLGLCDRGKGAALLESGDTQIGGRQPINPSGGVLSGVPVILHGLRAVAEAALQLKGEAGEHQVDGAQRAIAHGHSGPAAQLHSLIALGTS
jgi:acetyl-CoA C-acetyltransferase